MICLHVSHGHDTVRSAVSLLVPALNTPSAWIALLSGMTGIFIERWLFFAEARHTVMLYYGARNG